MIRVSHLRKEYECAIPIEDLNIEINKGEVISIIGPSGTGKSTFLRCLNMLETPTSGTIIFDGEEITAKGCRLDEVRRKMGMVFQSFNLFNHMNVIENIMYAPRKVLGLTDAEAYERGMDLLKTVGLADRANAYPDELSGGQKQRVAIARALAMEPEVLLFDEPTSALDPTMVGEVLGVIRGLAYKGMTMIIVTHEMRFARTMSTRVLYMDEGGIYEDGSPEQIFENPKKEKTRLFIKQLKVLEKDITKKDFNFPIFLSEVEGFVHKHMISADTAKKMQMLLGNVALKTVLQGLEDDDVLHFQMEYSANDGTCTIDLTWNGEEKNPLDNMEEVEKTAAEEAAKSLCYSYDREMRGNRLKIEI